MNFAEAISEILQLSKSKTAKDSAIVLAGSVASSCIGFIATILIIRTLDPAEFGLFSVALAVMVITSQLSDFGISIGLVRFASLYLQNDDTKSDLMFKVSFKIKLIITTLVFLIGFFVSDSLAVHVLGNPELTLPLKLAFIGASGTSLVSYTTATLQARQSFKRFTFVNLIIPVGKLTLIGLLFLTYRLNLHNALITIMTLPFIAFLVGSLMIPKDFLKAKGNEKEIFKELFHFSKWISISTFCVIIFMRLDVLMLTYFKTAEIVGYYSAAYTFAFIFPILTGTITTVLLPKVSELSRKEQHQEYIRKSLKFTIPIILPLVIVLFLAKPMILFIYGDAYLASTTIFQILIIGFTISIIVDPISLVIYSLNRPHILAYLTIILLILKFFVNLFLIPSSGAIGAAIATLLVRIVGATFIGGYLYFSISGQKS